MLNGHITLSRPQECAEFLSELETYRDFYKTHPLDQNVLERLAAIYSRFASRSGAFRCLAEKDPALCLSLVRYVVDENCDVLDWHLEGKRQLISDLFAWAIQHQNLGVCRWLIDQQSWCPEEVPDWASERPIRVRNWVAEEIQKKGLPDKVRALTKLFFVRRPKVGELEKYSSRIRKFIPAHSRLERFIATKKPIALIHVADHDQLHKLACYGAVTRFFAPATHAMNACDLYDEMAQTFTVLRVRVSDENQFVPILDKTHKLFPKTVIAHWMLHGHGGPVKVGLREGVFDPKYAKYFTDGDTEIMREVANRLEQGTISVLGCGNAEGAWNLARQFSKHSQGIPVAGCSGDSYLLGVHIWKGKTPALFPCFLPQSNGSEGLIVYKNGRKILDENPDLRSRL